MFEPGRILQVGGGSRDASLIDINTITPQLTPVVTPFLSCSSDATGATPR